MGLLKTNGSLLEVSIKTGLTVTIFVRHYVNGMDGLMVDLRFYLLQQFFFHLLYQDNGRIVMNSCVQWY